MPCVVLFFHLLLFLSIFTICKSDDYNCVYTMYVKTGSMEDAGTDSNIGLTIYDAFGNGIQFTNLAGWGGLMDAGTGHNYYERGNLDIFSGRAPCLSGPVCSMTLTSDGSFPYAGWYCELLEVSSVGLGGPCSHQKFAVDRWLAVDEPPKSLTVTMNECSTAANGSSGEVYVAVV